MAAEKQKRFRLTVSVNEATRDWLYAEKDRLGFNSVNAYLNYLIQSEREISEKMQAERKG